MLLEVGRIEKAHGLRGEVVVKLTTNVTERVRPGSVLALDAQGTEHLEIVASRRHQHRWIVGFEQLRSREDAEAVHGRTLYAEPITDDPEALWIHELIGAEVVERDGRERGMVVSVIDNPASDLLELDSGALVPLRFVVEHGRPSGGEREGRPSGEPDGTRRLVVEVPVGLFGDDEDDDASG